MRRSVILRSVFSWTCRFVNLTDVLSRKRANSRVWDEKRCIILRPARTALPTRVLMTLIRSYGHFGPSTLDPLLIRHRPSARASLERILAWDFDRVIVAHGDVLEHGGREALRRGYSWLLTP